MDRLRQSVAVSAKFCSTPEELCIAQAAWKDYYAISGDMDLEGLFLGDERRFNRDYVQRTVARCGRVYRYVDPQFKEDRKITLAAIGRWHGAYYYAHDSLSLDRGFAEEAFALNFNVLPLIKNPTENMRTEYSRMVMRLRELGIEFPERLNTRTASEIIRNRENLHGIDPTRIALFAFPTYDWNRAFTHHNIADFIEMGYLALYYESASALDFSSMRRELGTIPGIEGSIPFFEMAAHSSILSSSFGGADPTLVAQVDPDRSFDSTDTTRGIAAELFRMRNFLALLSVLSVRGCGAGGGRSAILNVANSLANIFLQCRVLAPTLPTNILAYEFDRARVARAVYFDDGVDYAVEATMDETPDMPGPFAASADFTAANIALGAQLMQH